jgi:hypothetical protein
MAGRFYSWGLHQALRNRLYQLQIHIYHLDARKSTPLYRWTS